MGGSWTPKKTTFPAEFCDEYYIKYEELISKTSDIHSYMLFICSSGYSKKAHGQHKIYCIWKILDANCNI